MNTVTVSEMKEIERKADEAGLSYYQMMENAGSESYRIITYEYPDTKSLFIFCGKGNNGGDGLVVARLAANDGIKVHVVLVEGIPVTKDALKNFNILPESVKVSNINEVSEASMITKLNNTVIVDALYGTGFHGELRENGRIGCNTMNTLNCPIVSLDIPSGCSADTSECSSGAVNADITISFHAFKNIHISGSTNCGKCVLADIGIN